LENDLFSEFFDNPASVTFESVEATEEEKDVEIENNLTPSVQRDIENLLTSGSISREVELAGHSFVLRTLTIGEELAVAEICGEYEGNFAQTKAIATATVAASLESIDGRPLMSRLGPDVSSNIRQKFQHIRNKWYWIIISELYEHYSLLLDKQLNAFEELRKK
jgi:hypothetical protein